MHDEQNDSHKDESQTEDDNELDKPSFLRRFTSRKPRDNDESAKDTTEDEDTKAEPEDDEPETKPDKAKKSKKK